MSHDFIRGAVAMGLLTASVFFFRFWRESRDRLFFLFAIAFLTLATNHLLLSLLQDNEASRIAPYVIRLLAFLIILAAITDKNLRRT